MNTTATDHERFAKRNTTVTAIVMIVTAIGMIVIEIVTAIVMIVTGIGTTTAKTRINSKIDLADRQPAL